MALRGLPREKVLATVVAPAREDADPRRQRRYAKQNKSYGLTTLRDPARRGQRRGAALPVQGQERQGLAPQGQGPAHRQDRARLPGPARAGAVPVPRRGRRAPGRRRPRTSTPTCGRSPAATSRPRISAPGPGRAGGDRARRSSRASTPRRRQEERQGGDRAGRLAARQHADHLPQVLRPSRGALGLRRGPAAPPGQGRGRERALPRTSRICARKRPRC